MNTKNTDISTKVPHRFAEPLDRGNIANSPYLGGAEERGGGTAHRNYKGFTLVELIVVITILTILGTIAFINIGGFSRSARDGTRVTDMASLSKAMELSYIKSSIYPTPSNGSGVTYSGGIVWTQWTIGDSVITMLSSSNTKLSKKPTDPKYPTIEYTYSLLNTGKEYQIGTAMEESTTAYEPTLIPQAHAATESFAAYLKGNYNGLVARAQTGSSPNITTYYLALPSITLKDLSGSTSLELSNFTTQSGNLVLHRKWNVPASYTAGQIQTPASSNFVTSLLQTSTGIVAYSTPASSLDSTGVTNMMMGLYNTYSGSNLKTDSTSAAQIVSFITAGSSTGALTDMYNGSISKSVGGSVVASVPPPPAVVATTFSLSSTSVTAGTTVTITHTCTTPPTSYNSSTETVATISSTTITTLTAGTTTITPVGGNCGDAVGKVLTVTAVPVSCPSGFIMIPSSTSKTVAGSLSTAGWCVAKYEMSPYNTTSWTQDATYKGWKCTTLTDGVTNSCAWNITSKSWTNPITYVSRNEWEAACSGQLVDQSNVTQTGGHLISAELWSILARDIEQQTSNWTSWVIGSGNLSRGHANNGPATTLPSGDDALWTAKVAKANGSYYWSRSFDLSNGTSIDDFAGNLREWYYDTHDAGGTPATTYYSNDNTQRTVLGGISTTPATNYWSNIAEAASTGRGLGYTYNANVSSASTYAACFGGYWSITSDAGVFMSSWATYSPSTYRSSNIGFRCVVPAR